MSSEPTPGLDDIASLMLERQRFESWIASLDARRDSTPEPVFARVREDYAKRLKAVTEQLIARKASLQSHVEMLSSRLTQLESDAQRVRDERAEAELRMQVGELAVTEWNRKVRESDEAITRLTEAQSQVRSELAQAREVITMVSAPVATTSAAPAAANGTPARPAPSASSGRVRAVNDGASGNGRAPGNGTGDRKAVNELDFLNSVVGSESRSRPSRPVQKQEPARKTPGPSAVQATPTPAPARPAEPDEEPDLASSLMSRMGESNGAGTLREDADAESLLTPKPPKKKGAAPAANGRSAPTPSGTATPAPTTPAAPKVKPLAANVTENNPIVLRPKGGLERHKTLKCAECSTLNYPSEWYCERCGAELSAI